MKKMISMLLALGMALSLAACGNNTPAAEAPAVKVEGTMQDLLNMVVEIQPV